ncbi:MAG: CotH kinase family protein [Bacteroidales bacterium]|nr:CotH kinase family protein [Bacteroidales bacterium]
MIRRFRWVLFVLLAGLLTNSIKSQIYINEFMASNSTSLFDNDYQAYSDWIELYNAGSTQIDIAGYYLTDDILEPLKWQFPGGITISAGGYLIVWADLEGLGNHTNFRLDSEGEQLLLFDNTGALVDSVSYGQQYNDLSYGRITDGGSQWSLFTKSTPNLANTTYPQNAIAPVPVFSPVAGFYSTSQSVTISTSDPSFQIRYTTDGTEPSASSTLYSGSITVSGTQVIRAKTFGNNYSPSISVSQTYFINETDFTFPVVSLSTTPANLWDNVIGIYVEGTNGVSGNCVNYPVNWNQDWERPLSIEYFDKRNEFMFQQNVGTKIYGGCTRALAQKSLAIIARNEYGKNSLDFPFFIDKPISSFKSIVLRNSGNDWDYTMFRDAYMQALVKDQMDVDYQAYQPSVVFINAQYWGIHGMREKINEHYIKANYGIDVDNIALMEWNSIAVYGSDTSYRNLITYLNSHSLADKNNYKYVTERIDINEYVNYMITQIFIGNTDWPGNNIKYWRPSSKIGKFRWILYDLDFGFGLYNSGSTVPSHNTLTFALETNGPDWPNPAWSTFLFRKLMENKEFKEYFAQQMDYHLNTTFSTPRMLELIDEMQAIIAPEMPAHIARWNAPADYSVWENNVNIMRTFANQRPAYMRQYLSAYLGKSGISNITIYNPDTAAGLVLINGNPIYDTLFNGDFIKGIPLSLSILPKNGYNIAHWEITPNIQTENVLVSEGDTWKYLSDGSDQGDTWKFRNFDDASWSTGSAQFGYGDGDETTILNYGADAKNKYITYYFRNKVVIDTSSFSPEKLTLRLMKDDGAVVYINNNEVLRSNLPTGEISYSTTATEAIGGDDETAYTEFTIDPSVLNSDTNIIAVEIHQVSVTSSDISFDLELKALSYTTGITAFSNAYPYTGNTEQGCIIRPVFENNNSYDSLYINEFMCENKNSIVDNRGQFDDWIEIYNASNKPINIAGLYLTDDLSIPARFVIPDGMPEQTTIQPNGFTVIWADDDTSQGPLHTNFKLDNDREQLALIQIIDTVVTIIDSLEFEQQYKDVSSGSYPDGTKTRMLFATVTPGAPNVYSPMRTVEYPIAQKELIIYPNPTNGWITIKLEDKNEDIAFSEIRIEIYTITGQLKYVKTISNTALIETDMSNYDQGLYIIRILTGNEILTGKIYKR